MTADVWWTSGGLYCEDVKGRYVQPKITTRWRSISRLNDHGKGGTALSIPQAIKISRMYRRVKQTDLDVPYSQQMLSAIESGKRSLAKDMAPIMAQKLDHPAMYAELARELTGFGPAWLDGPNVDLHRAAVREKCIEELREAIDSMGKLSAYVPPEVVTDRDRKERYEHLMQVMDAIEAGFMHIGVQCLDYGFSMRQLSQDHYNKLRSKRYIAST